MIVKVTPVAIPNIRWKTDMIFFVLNAAFTLIVFPFYPGSSLPPLEVDFADIYLPETSGRILKEIDLRYAGDFD